MMRIRLSLSLTFTKDRADGDEPHEVDDKGAPVIERSKPHPIGFNIDTTTYPQDRQVDL